MTVALPAIKILIVDDERAILDYMQTLLERDGYQVKTLSDPLQVEEEVRHGGYHLIVLDLMMPRLDGHGFLQSQSEDPSLGGIPVVLVTAQPADRARAFSAVRGVAAKPLDVGPLLQLINRVCAR